MLTLGQIAMYSGLGLVAGFVLCARWARYERRRLIQRNRYLEEEVKRLTTLLRTRSGAQERLYKLQERSQ